MQIYLSLEKIETKSQKKTTGEYCENPVV